MTFKTDRRIPELPKGKLLKRAREVLPKVCAEEGGGCQELETVYDHKARRCGYLYLITAKDGVRILVTLAARKKFHGAEGEGGIDSFDEPVMAKARDNKAPFFLRFLAISEAFYLFPREAYFHTGTRQIADEDSVKTYEFHAKQGTNLRKWLRGHELRMPSQPTQAPLGGAQQTTLFEEVK